MKRYLGRGMLMVALLVCALVAIPVAGEAQRADPVGFPLEPTRTVSFTTDEGTWLDLDVSPDGRTIVFEMLGDLYTLPITGGKATRITSGFSYDAQPRFSPDGAQIVFVSDRGGAHNVWIGAADGTGLRMITRGDNSRYQSPEWTPDGHIAVLRGAGLRSRVPTPFPVRHYPEYDYYKLVLLDLRGGTGTPLPVTGGKSVSGPAFGSDPRYVYAAAGTLVGYGSWSIVVYDRDTGKTATRVRRLGGAVRPIISADNRWLVYGTRHDAGQALRLVDLTTGDDRMLVADAQRDEQESWTSRDLMPASAFTPDGQTLIIYNKGGFWRIAIPGGEATKIPFTADVELGLAPLERFQYPLKDSTLLVRQIRGARPSPDGRRLVFTALNKLWVMELVGCESGAGSRSACQPRRLTSEASELGEHGPVWSPDGQFIAYVTWTNEGQNSGGDIYRVSATSSRPELPERLTTRRAVYDTPTYSSDGRRIVAQRRGRQHQLRGGGGGAELSDLVWLPSDGGEATVIAPGTATPQFTRDVSRVWVAAKDGNESVELVSMRWDGQDRRVEVTVPGAQNVWISPDGTQAIATGGPGPQLFHFAMSGVPADTINLVTPAASGVPLRKLTSIAAHFSDWSRDAKTIHYSIGRSFFTIDAPSTADGANDGRSTARQLDVTLVVPQDRPRGTVVFRGARLVTMNGNEVIENGDLVVTDNRITAVGASGRVAIPDGAEEIDVSGKTILPGYVDAHGHVGAGTWDLLSTSKWEYQANLAYGVTTVRDPSTGVDAFGYAELVQTGAMLGPRLYSTGPALHGDQNITSLEDARNLIARYHDFYGTNYIKEYSPGERKVRQWIIMAAREKRVTAVTDPDMDIAKYLTEVWDGYHEIGHGWSFLPIYKDLAELVAASKTAFTATLITSLTSRAQGDDYFYFRRNIHDDPKLRRFFPHEEIDRRVLRRGGWYAENQFTVKEDAEGLRKMIEAGALVAIGGHGNLQGLGYHWELEIHSMGDIPTREILRSATINGAIALGLDQDLGSLETGKLADLQVLDRNPLLDIQNTQSIRFVMLNGRLYDANTLDEVWPRQRALPRQWWWQ